MAPQLNLLPHFRGDRWASSDPEHKTIVTMDHQVYISTIVPNSAFITIRVKKSNCCWYNLNKVIEVRYKEDN